MSEDTQVEVTVSEAHTARKSAQTALSAALEATRGRSGLSAEEKVGLLTEARDAAREAVAALERAVEVSV